MPSSDQKPRRILLPILGEFRRLGDGSYQYRPIIPEPDGDTWLSVKDAGSLLKWTRTAIYEYLGDLLVYERPLKRKVVVSLKSVLKLRAALRALDFWEDQTKQTKLREWVFEQMKGKAEGPPRAIPRYLRSV